VLAPRQLTSAIRGEGGKKASVVKWERPTPPGREVWSDHYQDIISILRH